jgi:hypothetical protein
MNRSGDSLPPLYEIDNKTLQLCGLSFESGNIVALVLNRGPFIGSLRFASCRPANDFVLNVIRRSSMACAAIYILIVSRLAQEHSCPSTDDGHVRDNKAVAQVVSGADRVMWQFKAAVTPPPATAASDGGTGPTASISGLLRREVCELATPPARHRL